MELATFKQFALWLFVALFFSWLLALKPYKPLFWHKSGKRADTHWIYFMKTTPPAPGTEGETNVSD